MRVVRDWPPVTRMVLTSILSAIMAGLLFVILSLLPFFLTLAWYGSRTAYDSPGHGAAVMLLSISVGALVSLAVFFVLCYWLYTTMSR